MTKKEASPLTQDLAVDWALLWSDYDHDGCVDLFLVNHGPETPRLHTHNEGFGAFTQITGLGNSYGVRWVDFDKDGCLDLR